jgi:hypothetical protein
MSASAWEREKMLLSTTNYVDKRIKTWMVQKMRKKIGSLLDYQLMRTRRNKGFNSFIHVIRCT